MLLKSFLVAMEHTAIILWATLGTALLNAGLNYVLIFGNFGAPELGIEGAAIASLTVTLLTLGLFAVYVARVVPEFELIKNFWRPDPEIMAKVFRLGLPIGLTSLAEVGLFTASAVMMGWLGPIPLAAHGVALQLAGLTFNIHIGFSQAATVRAGRALGRRDEPALRRGGLVAIGLSALVALCTSAVFLGVPDFLVSLFIDPAEPARAELIAVGSTLVMVAALFQSVDAGQVLALGLLRGVQDTAVPMLIASVSYWIVGLAASWVLGFTLGMGALGVWLGLTVGLACAGVLLMLRFWTRSVKIG